MNTRNESGFHDDHPRLFHLQRATMRRGSVVSPKTAARDMRTSCLSHEVTAPSFEPTCDAADCSRVMVGSRLLLALAPFVIAAAVNGRAAIVAASTTRCMHSSFPRVVVHAASSRHAVGGGISSIFRLRFATVVGRTTLTAHSNPMECHTCFTSRIAQMARLARYIRQSLVHPDFFTDPRLELRMSVLLARLLVVCACRPKRQV